MRTFQENEELVAMLKEEFKDLPFFNAKISTLGGREQATVIITVGFDPKEAWSNGIFLNSRSATFFIWANDKMECQPQDGFAYQPEWSRRTPKIKFRKRNYNEDKLVSNIRKFYKEFQDYLHVEKPQD